MKRTLILAMAVVMALGMTGTALAQGQGKGKGPSDRAERGNSLVAISEPAEIESVTAQTSNPDAVNFEDEFTFYRVDFEPVEYDRWVYREPSRLGSDNHVAGSPDATASAFWFGVTGPDADGIQHEIVHDGTVWSYYVDDEGSVKHLQAEFSDGELLHVNGVQPTA